jgi:hypothetical protein
VQTDTGLHAFELREPAPRPIPKMENKTEVNSFNFFFCILNESGESINQLTQHEKWMV